MLLAHGATVNTQTMALSKRSTAHRLSTLHLAINGAGERLAEDRGIRAVVLSGEGRCFCAGLDMASFQQMQDRDSSKNVSIPLATSGERPGNMAQRAALVRTLALRPSCLLLDEPFGALDPMLREQLQEDLQGLLSGAERPSVVVVTHDIGEALVLGDEVLVLGSGCHVRGRVAVAAARPRAAAWRTDAQSLDLERQIRALLAR